MSDHIEQSDPRIALLMDKPWFLAVLDRLEDELTEITNHGVTEGTVCIGNARLCLDDPLAGALVQIGTLPASELAFVVLRVPDTEALLDAGRQVRELSDRVRAANPNGYLLVLPENWSFRTMLPDMARSFATNMIAFVSDEELAKIGLQRIETP